MVGRDHIMHLLSHRRLHHALIRIDEWAIGAFDQIDYSHSITVCNISPARTDQEIVMYEGTIVPLPYTARTTWLYFIIGLCCIGGLLLASWTIHKYMYFAILLVLAAIGLPLTRWTKIDLLQESLVYRFVGTVRIPYTAISNVSLCKSKDGAKVLALHRHSSNDPVEIHLGGFTKSDKAAIVATLSRYAVAAHIEDPVRVLARSA